MPTSFAGWSTHPDDFESPPEPCRGEKRLLVALLHQALYDLRRRPYQAQAEQWLQSAACAWVCEWLDLDATRVREAVLHDRSALLRRLRYL